MGILYDSLQNWSWIVWQKFGLKATFLQILHKLFFIYKIFPSNKQQNFENLISHNICTEFFKKNIAVTVEFPWMYYFADPVLHASPQGKHSSEFGFYFHVDVCFLT